MISEGGGDLQGVQHECGRTAYRVLAGKAEEKRLLLVIRNIFKGQHGVDTLS
jgi:hypothetical protein